MTNRRYVRSIAGHTCSGLVAFQESDNDCRPSFNEDGLISGCGSLNNIRVTYCPFCGVKLVWESWEIAE